MKKLWAAWNIRGVILFSLSLQTTLILFSPFRKSTANKLTILLIWSAYLLADWAANFAVGLISKSQGDTPDPSTPADNIDLLAFWPPFLLLHLGSPDPITAFSLEDNELWLRHLLGLIFQALAVIYVFVQSLPKNKLVFPTVLMFLAGIIKYLERTLALYRASLGKFRDSVLEKPVPGPNYAKFMKEYASKKEAKLPTQIVMIREPNKGNSAGFTVKNEDKLDDLEVVQYAYQHFSLFKGLIVDLIFSFRDRNESRDFFTKRTSEDALRIVEVELNFFYEVLYTKMEVVYSVAGCIFRFISIGSVVAALSFFHFEVKENGHFDKFDVKITYTLFLGAIGLDAIALFVLIFSDRTFAALKNSDNVSKCGKIKSCIAASLSCFLIPKRPKWHECQTQHSFEIKHKILTTPFLCRRWSGYVSGHNLVSYCLKGGPTRVHKVKGCVHFAIERAIRRLGIVQCCQSVFDNIFIRKIFKSVTIAVITFIHLLRIHKLIHFLGFIVDKVIDCFGLTDFVNGIRYVYREPLTEELWKFMFDDFKKKSQSADDPETAKRIFSGKGDWILQDRDSRSDRSTLTPYVSDVDYDQGLLLWHIATDLLYHTEKRVTKDSYNYREFSKLLSDYMLYLLVMQPTMMSAVAGIGKIRFRDTCAEADRFFKRSNLKLNEDKKACEFILSVNTDVKPSDVKGDRSKSVLFDASMLAKELKRLEDEEYEDKWKLMSQVWVQLLSYAAIHCRTSTHVRRISKGGELITFVWLLMAHFGLGEQFQIKGHTRAKLIAGK